MDDQFSISGGLGRGSPTICGTNTGYHSKCFFPNIMKMLNLVRSVDRVIGLIF